jgi:bifunctional DNA-binding transcriptional regulator/antitoxin component of YhaV-PrlF toxin-antitoxin module
LWEAIGLAILKVDDRYRVVLDKEIREKLQVEPGDSVLAIASTNGVLVTSLKGKKYETLHPGFNYREEEHEASRYLFTQTKKKTKRTTR